MGKIDFRTLNPRKVALMKAELVESLRKLGLNDSGQALLFDLLEESEAVMLARRLRIARSLLNGNSINRICDKMEAGEATVRAIDRWLQKRFPNYRSAIPQLQEHYGRTMPGIDWDGKTFRIALQKEYPKSSAELMSIVSDESGSF